MRLKDKVVIVTDARRASVGSRQNSGLKKAMVDGGY
jgi:hypothetical protein